MSPRKQTESAEFAKRRYPDRPVASVAVCVLDGDKILVAKRANPPSQGLWSVPGGKVELGETIEETARREIQEECGISIEPGRMFNVESLIYRDEKGRIEFHYVVTYIIARYVSGEIRPDSDALDVRWVTIREMESLELDPDDHTNVLKAFEIGYA